MPHEDNYAFDAMNAADPDTDIGGAIKYSSYEMDMTPEEQGKYKETLLGTLDSAYRGDPHKGKLSFKNWLKNLKPELVAERARKWEEIREDNKDVADYQKKMQSLEPVEAALLEDSGRLQRLLDKHTGSLKDIYPIIGELDKIARPIEEFKVPNRAYRR